MKHHFVQYHNEEERGPLSADDGAGDSGDDYTVVSKKYPQDAIGSIVWLVVGSGRPRRYSLGYVFEVSETGTEPSDHDGSEENYFRGPDGFTFSPALPLSGAWFEDFLAHQSHFSFGLNTIDAYHVQELLKATRGFDPFIEKLWDDFVEARTVRRRMRASGKFEAVFHPLDGRVPPKRR